MVGRARYPCRKVQSTMLGCEAVRGHSETHTLKPCSFVTTHPGCILNFGAVGRGYIWIAGCDTAPRYARLGGSRRDFENVRVRSSQHESLREMAPSVERCCARMWQRILRGPRRHPTRPRRYAAKASGCAAVRIRICGRGVLSIRRLGGGITPAPHPPAALVEFGLHLKPLTCSVLLLQLPLYYFYHPPR